MFYPCGYRMENMGHLGGEWQQPGSRGDGSGGGSDGGAEDGSGGRGRAGGVESSGGGCGGVMEMVGAVEVMVVLAVPRHRALGLLSHLMWTQKVGLLPSTRHTATPRATCLLPWAYLLLDCSLRINQLALPLRITPVYPLTTAGMGERGLALESCLTCVQARCGRDRAILGTKGCREAPRQEQLGNKVVLPPFLSFKGLSCLNNGQT